MSFSSNTSYRLLLLSVLLSIASLCSAQTDTTKQIPIATDTLIRDSLKTSLIKKPVHPPKQAALMSACLPGLGQVYNRKAWKVPIIYAGFGALGYGFAINQHNFSTYRDALRLRYDNDPATTDAFPQYGDDDLVTLKQYYQRFRDLTVIGMTALYALNIIDAAVDAHLFYFDISDDISLRFTPFYISSFQAPITGLSLQLSWH